MKKLLAMILVLALAIPAVGCGKKEAIASATTTTVSGMVVAVEGNVISLMKTENMNMGSTDGSGRPSGDFEIPEDFEGFEGMGGFPGGSFDGTLPEGETFPNMEWDGQMPEGFEGFEGMQRPEGFEGMEPPEGFEGMERPEGFEGMEGRPSRGEIGEDVETTDIDITGAHISVEIEDGKATGSMEDITVGCYVTITMDANGKVTNVLVTSSGFGGFSKS